MTEPIKLEVVCPACGASVAANRLDCGVCGAEVRTAPRLPSQGSFTDSKWFIVASMVFAALFLGFPLLWRSTAFSRGEKVFWTLAVTVETIVVFAAFGWAMWWCWQVWRATM